MFLCSFYVKPLYGMGKIPGADEVRLSTLPASNSNGQKSNTVPPKQLWPKQRFSAADSSSRPIHKHMLLARVPSSLLLLKIGFNHYDVGNVGETYRIIESQAFIQCTDHIHFVMRKLEAEEIDVLLLALGTAGFGNNDEAPIIRRRELSIGKHCGASLKGSRMLKRNGVRSAERKRTFAQPNAAGSALSTFRAL